MKSLLIVAIAATCFVPGTAYALNAPAKLTATAVSPTEIDLKWQDKSNNETGFRIWRGDGGQMAAIVDVGADITSYSDNSVTAGKTYSYKVEAVIEGAFSSTATATTPSGGGGGGGNAVWTPITGDPAYKLVYDDEFNGTALDTAAKWYAPVDQPDQTYPNTGKAQMLIANVSVHDGVLDLKVTKGPTPDGSEYGTAALTARGATIAGQPIQVYWEARMKMMDQARGLLSGFWTDTSPNWNFPEADFNEYWQAQSPRSTRQNYNNGNDWVLQANYDTGQNLAQGYHVFGAHWTPQALVFYIDGVETARTTNGTNRSDPQWYALVNAGAGGGDVYPDASTLLPNHVYFDYVHVYSAQAGATAIPPDANYGGPGDNRTGVALSPTGLGRGRAK